MTREPPVALGMIHGRFQPFHNGHLEYMVAAAARCTRLAVGITRYCRRGQGHLCVKFACTGLSAETGGLAQLAVVKEYQVAPLPDEVSDLEGAVDGARRRGGLRGGARRRHRW